MLHALPFVTSAVTDDLLRATRRLEQASHESWVVDWQRLVLVCSHGVQMNPQSAVSASQDGLHSIVEARHDVAGVMV
ncbi:MAG: hypothetical protein C1O27_000632 [Chloroflexi bacterium]|jgi:hypothetical protein|nr:MAG: hypothetical protein C1O27_000632 [Chloroflexota bacterium]